MNTDAQIKAPLPLLETEDEAAAFLVAYIFPRFRAHKNSITGLQYCAGMIHMLDMMTKVDTPAQTLVRDVKILIAQEMNTAYTQEFNFYHKHLKPQDPKPNTP